MEQEALTPVKPFKDRTHSYDTSEHQTHQVLFEDSDEEEFTGYDLERIMYFASVLRSSQEAEHRIQFFGAWQEYVGDMKLGRKAARDITPFFILHPQGKLRLILDFFGLIFILADLFRVPMALGFEDYTEPWELAIVPLIFWTVEMFSNFSTALHWGRVP